LITAIRDLIAGNFREAAEGFERELLRSPDNIAAVDGLSKALQGLGDYRRALPLLKRVHAYQKAENPSAPGQLLYIACAYWCETDRKTAIILVQELCAGLFDGSIGMAPDQAGGATYVILLHYMALTAKDEVRLNYSLQCLQNLSIKYERNQKKMYYPAHTVRQILGLLDFEDVLEAVTGVRTISAAYSVAQSNGVKLGELSIALFHDGAIRRSMGDEPGCIERMKAVFALGPENETIRWQLARHETLKN
jgi:hypothetical protein